MIESKTFFKIVGVSGALLGAALFASAPSLVAGTWNFPDFIKTYVTGLIMGTIFTIPFWLVVKYVKRE